MNESGGWGRLPMVDVWTAASLSWFVPQLRWWIKMHWTELSLTGRLIVIAVVTVACAIFISFIYLMEIARRRRYFAALQRVRERTPCSDEEFIRSLGFDRMSREAAVALTLRQVLADILGIPR